MRSKLRASRQDSTTQRGVIQSFGEKTGLAMQNIVQYSQPRSCTVDLPSKELTLCVAIQMRSGEMSESVENSRQRE
jgi:hypothetical protein